MNIIGKDCEDIIMCYVAIMELQEKVFIDKTKLLFVEVIGQFEDTFELYNPNLTTIFQTIETINDCYETHYYYEEQEEEDWD